MLQSIGISALLVLITCSACSLEAPPAPPTATSLNDGQFPREFNWKLTAASTVPVEDLGYGAVVIRRDNGDVVFRGNQEYAADVNLPALLGQKEWIISDGHGNEMKRVAVTGAAQ